MKLTTAIITNTGWLREPFRPVLLRQARLHNTSINTILCKADVGDLYFRIKRTDAEGNVIYSIIKVVNLQLEDQRPGIQIYPNPVNQKILIQFDEQQTGNYVLELVGTTGQVIARKQVQLSGASITNMDLSAKPASGIYFLRAVNVANNRQFLTKVIVN